MAFNLKARLRQAAGSALDLLLPINCLGCGQEGGLLCPQCIATLPRLESPCCDLCSTIGIRGICNSCREQSRNFSRRIDGIRAPYLMQGLPRELVHQFKYRDVRLAAPLMGGLLADYLTRHPMPGDLLLPTPLHPKRLRERGYNQSALLAREISEITGLPVVADLLYRRQNTPAQTRAATRQQRLDNMRDVFACREEATDQSVIVVDDVSTTGSTLNACAAALKEAGARSVWGLAFAKETGRNSANAKP